MDVKVWEKSIVGNEVLGADEFYISYNPAPGMGLSVFAADNSSDETALYSRADEKWRILNGDFRKQYEAAFNKGMDACIAVYNKYKDKHKSSWSS